jgi:ubiquinone/menaquinone biosynthesis C-methylase UbiE
MSDSVYVFSDRDHEQQRLARQAAFFDPLTERLFHAAGLNAGAHVLDLGSGAGDVALLAAGIVGSTGSVTGVERDPRAVTSASQRAAQAGMTHIRFLEGDAETLDNIEGPFDAVVCRLVLMHLPDPKRALMRAAERLRPGGLICVQEPDMAYEWASPMTPLFAQLRAWALETFEHVNVKSRMALSLHTLFLDAGLPMPQLRLESAVGDFAWGWANVMCGILPLMEKFGVANAAQLQPDTLADRLQDEITRNRCIVIAPPMMGAWVRLPV